MIWSFTLHLKGIEATTTEMADAIYGAMPDSSLSESNWKVRLGFDREAPTLEDAIRSAIHDVHHQGLEVGRVEIETQDLDESTWATICAEAT